MRTAIFLLLVACGGGSGGPSGPCGDLSLADCRVTDGCAPDLCAGCFCDIGYRGCLAATETPDRCPQLGCPSAVCCSTDEQCEGQGACTQPGAPEGCGACTNDPGDCTMDDECTGNQICEPIACHCSGASRCVTGCADDPESCPEGTTCDLATSRCERTFCGVDEDCPPSFVCGDAGCLREECTDDLDCDGFCVLGACFSNARGECRFPPA